VQRLSRVAVSVGASPSATERRVAWFDVPGSTLRLELREAPTLTATRLSLCTDPRGLRAVAARLGQAGVATVEAGLTRGGDPRAISFRDPGRNRWELCAPLGVAPAPMSIHRGAARLRRSLTARARWLLSPGPVEARYHQQRSRDDAAHGRVSAARRQARRAPPA
jgi:hypothetical protein